MIPRHASVVRRLWRTIAPCVVLVAQSLVIAKACAADGRQAHSGLGLTLEEQAWLGDHPVVRVGANFFAPVSIFDDDGGPLDGVTGDYLDLVSEMTGIDFELVVRTHRDHRRAMQALYDGEVDLVSGTMATNSSIRDGLSVGTAPYVEFPVVIVSRADEPYIDDIHMLAGRQVVGAPPAIGYLERRGVDAIFEGAPPDEGLTGVATGRWDVFVANLPTVTHYLAESPTTNIKINGELPDPAQVVMTVRPDDAILARILDKAFAHIPADAKDEIWRRWFRITYEEDLVASPWLWSGIGGGCLVLGVVMVQACRLQRRVRHVQGAFESLDQHLMSAHLDGGATVTEVTNALCQATGFDGAELVGRSLGEIGAPSEDADCSLRAIMDGLRKGRPWKGEFKVHRKDGTAFWAHAILSPRRRKGETVGFTVIWQDITESKHFRDLSLRDELTGLFNRRHFNAEAPTLRAEAERENSLFALLAIDVDCFKAYNDEYGHGAGDKVLAQVGRVLSDGLRRENDLAFRIGGEEFAVAFVVAEETDALRIAETLRASLERCAIPHVKGPAGVVTASLGLVLAGPDDPRGIDQLYAAADEALYEAKNAGRNRVAVAAMSA